MTTKQIINKLIQECRELETYDDFGEIWFFREHDLKEYFNLQKDIQTLQEIENEKC